MTITRTGQTALETAHRNLLTIWKQHRKLIPVHVQDALALATNQLRVGLEEIKPYAKDWHAKRRPQD